MRDLAEARIKALRHVRVDHVVYELRAIKPFEIETEYIEGLEELDHARENIVEHQRARIDFHAACYQRENGVERLDVFGVHTVGKIDGIFEKPFDYRHQSVLLVEKHSEQFFDRIAVSKVLESFFIRRARVGIRRIQSAYVLKIGAEYEFEKRRAFGIEFDVDAALQKFVHISAEFRAAFAAFEFLSVAVVRVIRQHDVLDMSYYVVYEGFGDGYKRRYEGVTFGQYTRNHRA